MLDLKDCIEKGLIKKIPPSKEQAHLSSQKASELLEEAKANLEEERHNSAALVGYVAAFNAARALLFKDGYREKATIVSQDIWRSITAKSWEAE